MTYIKRRFSVNFPYAVFDRHSGTVLSDYRIGASSNFALSDNFVNIDVGTHSDRILADLVLGIFQVDSAR